MKKYGAGNLKKQIRVHFPSLTFCYFVREENEGEDAGTQQVDNSRLRELLCRNVDRKTDERSSLLSLRGNDSSYFYVLKMI